MNNGFQHTQEAIKQRGEVFTPDALVKDMLDKLPPILFTDPTKTFCDNSCGNGQFLHAVLMRKMEAMKTSGRSKGKIHRYALKTIFGVELDEKNAEECRKRLLNGSTDPYLRVIVEHNIICADALDDQHIGWSEVGFYWDEDKKPIPVYQGNENGEHAPVMDINSPELLEKREQAWAKMNAKKPWWQS